MAAALSTILSAGCSAFHESETPAPAVDTTCTARAARAPDDVKAWLRGPYDAEGRPKPGTPAGLAPWLQAVGTQQAVITANCGGR